MVPAVPLLFIAAVPVLMRLHGWIRWALILPTVVVSWAISMTREDVPRALIQVFTQGLELPLLTVLSRMASGYLPSLTGGVSPLAVFGLVGVVIWLIWRGRPEPWLAGEPARGAL
jgi:hypothetical protein